nr:gamma-glutamyl-gamma-aminobutyrate hydrolase family protein [Parachlamydiaceae bacterium]
VNEVGYIFNYYGEKKTNSLMKDVFVKNYPQQSPQATLTILENLIESQKKVQSDYELEFGKEAADLKFGTKIDLAKLLHANGFSKVISGLNFSSQYSMKNLDFKGLTFNNCKFYWTNCSNSNFENTKFLNCNISNLCLLNSNLINCKFDKCTLREVMFTGSNIDNTEFIHSELICSSFEDTNIKNSKFNHVAMPATHFLDSLIENTEIVDSNLQNTVFFDQFHSFDVDDESKKTARITKPTAAFLINPEVRGVSTPKAFMKLDQNGNLLPLRITMHAQKVSPEKINQECENAFKEIGPYDATKLPIPQQLIAKIKENPEFESARILRKAEKLAQYVNSFCLPGGEDLSPALYGQAREEHTDLTSDYRRTILELGIIDQSYKKGIPLMAICRGFQLSNVYFGAQLLQNVIGHKTVQKYELSTAEKTGIFGGVMKNSIIGAAAHHQAIPITQQAANHLEPSVIYGDLVKVSEAKQGAASPMILLQFHPEFYNADSADSMMIQAMDTFFNITMSKQNDDIWKLLSNSAEAHRIKKTALTRIRGILLNTI